MIISAVIQYLDCKFGSIFRLTLLSEVFSIKINSAGRIALDGMLARTLKAEIESLGDLEISNG
jgi:hypothetical protein